MTRRAGPAALLVDGTGLQHRSEQLPCVRSAVHFLALTELLGIGLLQLGPAHPQVQHGPRDLGGQFFPDAVREAGLRDDCVRVSLEPPRVSGSFGPLGKAVKPYRDALV
ncbi:hypothetical protein [Streptomyces sp. NPDC058011]|uniref:hypothetical protein n=1 Tax=Streptomyces sp. NPDC058011 TaxID=3346305 RepID=UPI0036E9640C